MRFVTRIMIPLALGSQFVQFAGAMGLPRESRPTFREWTDDNNVVLVIQLLPDTKNAEKYQRDAVIIEIIRGKGILAEGAKTIPIDKPIPVVDPMQPRTLIIFGERLKGQWEWNFGMNADADAIRCVKGLLKLDLKNNKQLLRFSFDFLASANHTLVERAVREWNNATAADTGAVAKDLPAGQIRALVEDRKAPRYVRDLACFLLGYCGEEKDVALIRSHMERAEEGYGPAPRYDVDPLKGYVLLKPKEGFAFVAALMKDSKRGFADRYRALLAARYIHDHHDNLIEKQDVERLFADVLSDGDLADFVINDFRRWKRWNYTDRVLVHFGKASHNVPVIKNAILRYALRCPDPACIQFVAEQRRNDRQWVLDNEEYLRFETAR